VLRILKFGRQKQEAPWGYLVASEGAVGRVRPGLNNLVGTVFNEYLISLGARLGVW
jgi:hypothetical protein